MPDDLATMKKTKFEQRIKNALSAFFDDEPFEKHSTLIVVENRELTQPVFAEQLRSHADKNFGYFKKLFSFVPGVLFVHLAAPAAMEFGFGVWALFFFLAGSFMIWAGIGNLKNKNHLLVPSAVILTALIFAAPFKFLPANLSGYYTYFYICVLPLLFIAAISAKGWVDKFEDSRADPLQ